MPLSNILKISAFFAIHLGCLLIYFVGFSWTALIICLALYLIRMFAITAGYHRYFSHRTYQTSRWFQFLIGFIGAIALVALGDNDPNLEEEYQKLGTTAGAYDDWHEGRDPAGITTQDPELMKRLDPVKAGRRLANYLSVLTMEAQVIARSCGKSHVHNLEPEDLVALTIEAAAMAKVPLAGTSWVPGT